MKSLLENERPDLVLLDLWMPVLSGDQVLKTIRADPKTEKLPVIIISASRDSEQIALGAGANDYLPKPFDIDQLINKVGSVLG